MNEYNDLKEDETKEEKRVNIPFPEALRRLRIEKGLSQQQLAEALSVDRSTVTKWETGDRQPDAETLARLSPVLDANVAELLVSSSAPDAKPQVILVDDERIILTGGLPVLRAAMPGAEVRGFTVPAEAVAFARENPVALAFLDIEMGWISGMDVCRELLEINPDTNVIFLTAFQEYALDAWESGACGYMMKPLTSEAVRKWLPRLRHPIRGLEGV